MINILIWEHSDFPLLNQLQIDNMVRFNIEKDFLISGIVLSCHTCDKNGWNAIIQLMNGIILKFELKIINNKCIKTVVIIHNNTFRTYENDKRWYTDLIKVSNNIREERKNYNKLKDSSDTILLYILTYLILFVTIIISCN